MEDDIPAGTWAIDASTRRRLRRSKLSEAIEKDDPVALILEAEESLDDDPDDPVALAHLADTLLDHGEFEIARAAFEHRLTLGAGDAEKDWLGVAICAFQTCDFDGAMNAASMVLEDEPDNARAHYVLGLAAERIPGKSVQSVAALVAASELSPEHFPLPVPPAMLDWERTISSAIRRLHPRLQAFYNKLPFRVEELPDVQELRACTPVLPPTIGAMYVGDPPHDEQGWQDRPDAIRLFARNLGRVPTEEERVEQLAHNLQEEALDWVGTLESEL